MTGGFWRNRAKFKRFFQPRLKGLFVPSPLQIWETWWLSLQGGFFVLGIRPQTQDLWEDAAIQAISWHSLAIQIFYFKKKTLGKIKRAIVVLRLEFSSVNLGWQKSAIHYAKANHIKWGPGVFNVWRQSMGSHKLHSCSVLWKFSQWLYSHHKPQWMTQRGSLPQSMTFADSLPPQNFLLWMSNEVSQF